MSAQISASEATHKTYTTYDQIAFYGCGSFERVMKSIHKLGQRNDHGELNLSSEGLMNMESEDVEICFLI